MATFRGTWAGVMVATSFIVGPAPLKSIAQQVSPYGNLSAQQRQALFMRALQMRQSRGVRTGYPQYIPLGVPGGGYWAGDAQQLAVPQFDAAGQPQDDAHAVREQRKRAAREAAEAKKAKYAEARAARAEAAKKAREARAAKAANKPVAQAPAKKSAPAVKAATKPSLDKAGMP